MKLQRITTEYVDLEDRVRVAAEDETGDRLILWLTRRLLDRLLPRLFSWLKREAADFLHAEFLLDFAQQAAQAALAAQPPVKVNAVGMAWLVLSVDVAAGDESMDLTFRGCRGEAVGLSLAPRELRQWLGILHQNYLHADWPLDAWPRWMRESAPADHAPAIIH